MDVQVFETIKCLDGKLLNLYWHNIRFNHVRTTYYGLQSKINLANFIKVPVSFKKGLFRCKVTYTKAIDSIEFIPHEYRDINSLKLIEDNTIDYKHKYTDRSSLTQLYEKRGDCDDILILKNGFITDSYTANPIFFDGETWWTPETPLLAGTQRAHLLSENKITECKICTKNLKNYKMVGLINAMWNLENMPIVDIQNILK